MLIEVILEYLVAAGGPDSETWKLWVSVMSVGLAAGVLLALL